MLNFKVQILSWIRKNPGIFLVQENKKEISLQEIYSQKELKIQLSKITDSEEKKNSLNPLETYLILLLDNASQLVLCQQGIAFPPDFTHSGELNLPNAVYCIKDINNFLHQLRHLALESDRRKEALELILILIALLDGAKKIGLQVQEETQEVEGILNLIEKSS
ncbi:MAG: hypothetical protein H7A32_02845 [Deltaproteobacteria bacterium]|nr:hypothetical protein [Deltaproteobacteria bacterium]